MADLLADPGMPAYLREARFAERVRRWGRAQARLRLIEEHLDGMGFLAAVDAGDPVVDAWMRAEAAAGNASAKLGLTPAGFLALIEAGEIPREGAAATP